MTEQSDKMFFGAVTTLAVVGLSGALIALQACTTEDGQLVCNGFEFWWQILAGIVSGIIGTVMLLGYFGMLSEDNRIRRSSRSLRDSENGTRFYTIFVGGVVFLTSGIAAASAAGKNDDDNSMSSTQNTFPWITGTVGVTMLLYAGYKIYKKQTTGVWNSSGAKYKVTHLELPNKFAPLSAISKQSYK